MHIKLYYLVSWVHRLSPVIGNWFQHAFPDETDPESGLRPRGIDVVVRGLAKYVEELGQTNWFFIATTDITRLTVSTLGDIGEKHLVAFITQKHQYADGHAVCFHNIDYITIIEFS